MNDELMKLIHGEGMDPDLEEAAFEKIVTHKPRVLPQLCRHLFSERRQIRGELAKLTVAAEKAKAQGAKAKAALKAISQPPLHPGILLRACEGFFSLSHRSSSPLRVFFKEDCLPDRHRNGIAS